MVRHAMRHVMSTCGVGTRACLGVDSLVACGVVNRGRSASRALNSEWNRAIGYSLCAGITLALHYVPSRLNPSDDPSRDRAVRQAAAKPPCWTRGAGTELDDWTAVPLVTRAAAGWVEMVLRLGVLRLRRRCGFRGQRVGEASNPGLEVSGTPCFLCVYRLTTQKVKHVT